MTFNNIWLLFLFAPLILLVLAELYEVGIDQIFPNAISRIKDHNYGRFNYDKHRLKFILFISGFFC